MKWSRRDFSRLSAMTALAGTLRRLAHRQRTMRTRGASCGGASWGWAASRWATSCLDWAVEDGEITALVSGHREKAEKQAAYTTCRRPRSTATTISTRSGTTKRLTRCTSRCRTRCTPSTRSARRRQASMCCARSRWRPAWPTADAMIEACRKAHVKLMIAYRCQYHPTASESDRADPHGAMGQVQTIESAFGFPISGRASGG